MCFKKYSHYWPPQWHFSLSPYVILNPWNLKNDLKVQRKLWYLGTTAWAIIIFAVIHQLREPYGMILLICKLIDLIHVIEILFYPSENYNYCQLEMATKSFKVLHNWPSREMGTLQCASWTMQWVQTLLVL